MLYLIWFDLEISSNLSSLFTQAEVVKNPELRAQFKQFINTDETISKDKMIEFVDMRGQIRPTDWPKDGQPQTNWQAPEDDVFARSEKSWVKVGKVSCARLKSLS